MFDVVLVAPEIATNTGNIVRLCANAGASLHLVEPLGFTLDDRRLRRAGLDYHELVDVVVHRSLDACLKTLGPRRFALSGRGAVRFDTVGFQPADVFVFGAERAGLDAEDLGRFPPEFRLALPMRPGNRSLNLANAVAVVLYEAWRQHGFAGAAPIGEAAGSLAEATGARVFDPLTPIARVFDPRKLGSPGESPSEEHHD